MSNRKLVYIAGPYFADTDADVDLNIEHARVTAMAVWALGAAVICPHTNSARFDSVMPEIPQKEWLERYLGIVEKCDAVYMMSNWKTSEGAKLERLHAQSRGLPIFYDLNALEEWLRK